MSVRGMEKKIKVIFMARETESSVLALKFLLSKKEVEIVRAVIRESDIKMKKLCESSRIVICQEPELVQDYKKGNLEADYIFSFYWKRAKRETLKIPKSGSINFHPGPLPEARGSGYHMAILENWGYFGATAHYMDEEFDTGEIIECRNFSIPSDILNKDLVQMAHRESACLFQSIVERILNGERLESVPQKEGRYFSLPELEKSKWILDTDTSEMIDRKIRAFWNPPYSGAKIMLQGKEYTVINKEVLEWVKQKLDE